MKIYFDYMPEELKARIHIIVKRIRLSAGAMGYRLTDIIDWLDSRQPVEGNNDN